MRSVAHVAVRALVLCALGLIPFTASSASDVWTRLVSLEGEWTGHETGVAGIGKGTRTYERILKDKFLLQRNTSRFDPQPQNPDGDVHEDLGIFSRDGARGRIVLRQFHGEGFINTYVDADSSTADRIVFVTEAIENAPPGWAARLTWTFEDADHFEETFELDSGSGFEHLLRNEWSRVGP